MRQCEACGGPLVRKTRARKRRGRIICEKEAPATFAARRFCDRACKAAAMRKDPGEEVKCPRCPTRLARGSMRGGYCVPCANEKRAAAARDHPEREREMNREKARRRREKLLEADWVGARCTFQGYRLKVPAAELRALFDAQGGRCALTGRLLDAGMHLDHRVPRALGGGDEVGNLRWVVEDANRAKRALSDEDFIALCRDVAAWADARGTA